MNRKFIRKTKRAIEKFKTENSKIFIWVGLVLILLIVGAVIFNNIKKSNEYNGLVKKVEEASLKYVDKYYPSINENVSIMLTLNDLIGELYISELENPYGSGFCDVSSNIEVVVNNGSKEVSVGLICGNKKGDDIYNPIESLKENQFNMNAWSSQDVRVMINLGDTNIYSVITNNEAVVENEKALNNEVVISEQGYSYIKINSYENDVLIKKIYTPIYKIDKEVPTLELIEETILVDQGTIYEKPNCIAYDNLTTYDQVSCTIMGDVNTEIVDSYPLEYKAVDLAGNSTTKKITVVVKSPLLVDVLSTKNFVGNPLNNYISFNNVTWRIMGHNGTNVKIVGPEYTSKVYDYSYSGYESSNVWLEDGARYKGYSSSLLRYLEDTVYESLNTRAKDMVATDVFEGGKKISIPSLSEWEICGGLNVTNSETWVDAYTSGTFMSSSCYLKQDDRHSYWTNTPYPNTTDRVWKIDANGSVGNNTISNSFYVLPVVYLQSNVLVVGGIGTSNDPYIIGQ